MKYLLPLAFEQLINALEDIEENYKIRYYLVGGLLVNLYSIFRITQDIDFVVDIETEKVPIKKYISILKKYNFQPLQDWSQAEIIAK